MENQPQGELFSKSELFERMTPEALTQHILMLGEKATEIEKDMNKASEILEAKHGLTVEDMLDGDPSFSSLSEEFYGTE